MRSCTFLSRFGNDARHRLELVVFDFCERIAHDRKTTERLCPRAESRQERDLIDEAHRISGAGAVVAHRSRRSCKAARHRSWITLRRSAIRRPRRDGGQECRPLHRARDGRRERRRSDRVAPGESLLPQLATGHVTPLRARINTHGLNRRYPSPVRGQGCAASARRPRTIRRTVYRHTVSARVVRMAAQARHGRPCGRRRPRFDVRPPGNRAGREIGPARCR